ncbi:MAG TPA: RES family NAD+ phosphorylase [Edaphobacter sp.]
MSKVYRLLRKKFSATPFDGEGSFRFGGRWSSVGTRVVYTAEHLSLAMIEYLAHIDPSLAPEDPVLAVAEVPDTVSRIRIPANKLARNWKLYPAPHTLAKYGDSFASDAKAAILIIPSVIADTEDNWILNPAHPDFQLISKPSVMPYPLDPRILASKEL